MNLETVNKDSSSFSQPEQIRDLIMSSSEPLVFKNRIKWNILHWSLEDWNKSLKNEEMEFRIGSSRFSKEPQWEKQTDTIKGKFDFFLAKSESDTKWLYFDYKHLKNVLLNSSDLRNVLGI